MSRAVAWGSRGLGVWERPQCCCLCPCGCGTQQGSTPSCSCGARRARESGLGIFVDRSVHWTPAARCASSFEKSNLASIPLCRQKI